MRRALLPLLWLLGGCTSWNVVTLPAPQDSTWHDSGVFRLTTRTGQLLRADSLLFGTDSVRLTRSRVGETRAIPRATLFQIEEARVDKNRTGILIVGLAAIAALAIIAVGNSFGGGSGFGSGY